MLSAFGAGNLFGERFGQGPARILALHGWARSHADFTGVLAPAGGVALDAIALDLPGFGATPPPPVSWGSPEYAAALLPALEEMAGRVVVCGHSFGGLVALQLAGLAPDRVAGLVLTGAPLYRADGPRSRPPAAYRLARRLARLGVIGEARLEQARQRYGSPDYRAAHGVMREVLVTVLAEQYEPLLDACTCPVELVWGALDTAAPLAVAERAARRLAHAELRVCEGVDHFVPTAAPDALRAAIERLA